MEKITMVQKLKSTQKWQRLLLTLSLATSLSHQALAATLQTTLTPEEAIKASLHRTAINSVTPTTIPGLYQVVAGKNVFYSDPTGRYLVFGHIYDLKTETDLTAVLEKKLNPNQALLPSLQGQQSQGDQAGPPQRIDWKTLPQKSAIIQNPQITEEKQQLAVFTDPECPYCKALEAELFKVKNIQVHYYLYPLTEIHPTSEQLSEKIWCSQDKLKALQESEASESSGASGVVDSNVYKKIVNPSSEVSCDLSLLKEIHNFGRSHHFDGTPILIRSDGAVEFGYMPISELSVWLNQRNTESASAKFNFSPKAKDLKK